ncbi:retrotransposon protein, putative, ty1-copia subclass [Tanacetum coccineum]
MGQPPEISGRRQPLSPTEGQLVALEITIAHIAWIKGSKEFSGLMLMTMKPEIQQNLENLHAHVMIQGVKNSVCSVKQSKELSSTPKIPPPPKREDPAKDSICHECGETGHWKRNCPQYLAELLKKKKNAASGAGGGSGIFVIELNTFLNRSWIYDTGCGTHICNTTQGLRASRKLKPGALSLYVGNGQREAVEAIGNFDLSLPSGLVIVLNNCHYAPSITRGVISVSRLYEDGFINRFVNNTIQVSRNNMVYFSAIPRDGIFEIDLSNSYANESSIYTVSNKRAKLDLDSALLWHCRLGHISKKRIEKLQHDGLLNSTDLRTFEKYVPKTTRPKSNVLDIHHDEEHELGDLGEPANYKSALLDPESDKWMNAMNVEMQSMKDNKVWDLVDLPPNGKTVGSKWLFKKKTDMDGVVHTYKARLVAKGYTQTLEIDYEENLHIPLQTIRAIRILSQSLVYDYEIWQMDVKTAFLNGYLSEKEAEEYCLSMMLSKEAV